MAAHLLLAHKVRSSSWKPPRGPALDKLDLLGAQAGGLGTGAGRVRNLMFGCDDGTIQVWNLETGGVRRQASGLRMQHFSPAGDFSLFGRMEDESRPWLSSTAFKMDFPAGKIVMLGEDRYIALSPDGHFRGSPLLERHLVYVAQTDAGQQICTPQDFEQRFGWRNDPEKVRLLDAAE